MKIEVGIRRGEGWNAGTVEKGRGKGGGNKDKKMHKRSGRVREMETERE